LKDLFEYSHHFNQKWAEIFVTNEGRFTDKSFTLFCHILNANQIWNTRLGANDKPFGVWDLHRLDELQTIDRQNFEQSLKMLDALDLKAPITYVNSKGDTYTNSVREILFHVVNHSTHHRGQIASEFRNAGMEPLVMDYVFHKRI
jgi:uncharacterized damage-inducible protein DinB